MVFIGFKLLFNLGKLIYRTRIYDWVSDKRATASPWFDTSFIYKKWF